MEFLYNIKADLTHELAALTRVHPETVTYSYSGENKSASLFKNFEIWENHLFGDFLSYHFSLLVLARGSKFPVQTESDTYPPEGFSLPKIEVSNFCT